MKRLNCCLLVLGAAVCATAFVGCSGDSSMKTEPVKGTVTLDGKPVAEATVMFSPVTEGEGLPASGMTDATGTYTLTATSSGEETAAAGGGTLPGEYYVGVIKSVQEEPMSEEEAYDKGVEYVAPAPGVAPEIVHEVPVKYNDPKTSGLKVTVQAGENTIPLELTSE